VSLHLVLKWQSIVLDMWQFASLSTGTLWV
jgi:hypothetical protein